MKTLLLLLISVLLANTGFAQFNSNDEFTGNWSENTSWQGGTAPDTNLNGVGENVNINGDITLLSDLSVSSVLTINEGDTLHIVGNLEVKGTGDIIVNGLLVVSGTYTGGGNAEVSNTGVVLIDGDLNLNGSSTIDNSAGDLYVTGSSDFAGAQRGSEIPSELSNAFITPQPVELLTFEGYITGSRVQLDWVTAMEENFDFFTIERAGADMKFKAVGKLQGQGNSTVEVDYSFTDESPLQGQALYRLKATDIDGSIEYHRIISVYFDGFTSSAVNVYPNPVSGHSFKVETSQGNINEIQLMDMSGRKVFSQQAQTGMTAVQLPQKIQAGAYVLVLTGISGEKYQERIMVL